MVPAGARRVIADLKPYPAMKNSGVEWLGAVPKHWEIRRMKTLLGERSEKGFPDKPLLAATQTKGVVRKEQYENRTVLAQKDLHLLKLVRVGDFVISLRSFQGGIEYAREQGIISPAYTILYPLERNNHAYLTHVFKSKPYIENLSLFVTGIRQGQNIDYEKLSRSLLPYPPLPEQAAIVRFLDNADRRIRRSIRAKEKLIALLEEQKQAIIHRAVTGQIDVRTGRLYPAYKDSGMEWLGDVPEHWEVVPLKHLVPQVTVGIVIQPAKLYVSAGVPCLRSLNISSGAIRSEDMVFISDQSNAEHKKSRIFEGDLVVVRTGQAGIAAIVTAEFDGANCIDILIVRRSPRLLSEYLLTYLNSWPARTDVQYRSVGAIQAHYNTSTLANLVVPVPPLAEQKSALHKLEVRLDSIVRSTQTARRQIDLLHEYRTRLIAEVVTGKLDVREAAARLPDEVEEPEPLDEGEALINGEEDLAEVED